MNMSKILFYNINYDLRLSRMGQKKKRLLYEQPVARLHLRANDVSAGSFLFTYKGMLLNSSMFSN